MGKRGGHHPVPGYFTLQGAQVEDRDSARSAKQALGREAARRQRRAGRKTKLGEAPKEQHAKELPKPGATPRKAPAAARKATAQPRTTTAQSRTAQARTTTAQSRTATAQARTTTPQPRTTTAQPRTTPMQARAATAQPRTATAPPRTPAAAPKRVKQPEREEAHAHQPRYLTDTARGLVRRVARVAFAPVALARAVVDRIRDRD